MNTKGHCYPKYIILHAVCFKLRFTLSYRDVEELMKIRGVIVDHGTIQRWVYKFTPFSEAIFWELFPLFVPLFCAEPQYKRISLHASEANW
jgi:transposase-like protein